MHGIEERLKLRNDALAYWNKHYVSVCFNCDNHLSQVMHDRCYLNGKLCEPEMTCEKHKPQLTELNEIENDIINGLIK